MKTKLLLTIAILFFAILAKSQAIVRPPINTESIYLTNFIWENDSIMKDSLYYIRFDNDRCFSIKGLYAGDEWEQLCAPNDSIYIDSLDIMICNNCYIVTDTTNFFVKRSSCNYNCWTYSFDGVTWLPWFCLPEIEPETKLYIFAKDSNLLNVYHRVYYNDSDSIGYKNNSRYIDKWLYYGVDSIYWRQSPDSLFKGGIWYNLPDTIPNDSLFMDGVWYNLPDTLPINLDSLIYVNNVPISIGDTIFTHDSIYYNGVWVLNDTIHIVDNSITNELDSFYYAGSWIKNGMTLTVPAIPSLFYIINGVPYYNQSEITIDESKWVYDTYGIHNNSMLMSTVGIGFDAQKWVRLYVEGLGEDKGAIYAHSVGDWAISGKSDTGVGVGGIGGARGISGQSTDGTGGVFESTNGLGLRSDSENDFSAYFNSPLGMVSNKINVGDPVHVLYSFPVADGDSLETIFTDGHGNLTFGQSGFYLLPDSVWKTGGDTINIYWDRYTDIYYDNIFTNDEVAIGVESCGGSKLKVVGNDIYPAISANQTSTGYSGSFSGGSGLYTDSLNTPKANISEGLTVGDSTVTTIRSGATFTIWQGTQAAYDAIGTKDAKTIYYIEQNFNIIQILFFLLMFFGSRGVFGQSNWAAVNIGTTEMKKIYVGNTLVWEKETETDTTVYLCGKKYKKVTIGTQTWLAENLHCDDGGGGIYSYNNDTEISDEYGYLYTWDAAMRIDTLINGWHLPSKNEIDQKLYQYINSISEYKCNNTINYTYKSLSSQSDWTTTNIACAVGNNLSANNATGYNLFPSGKRKGSDGTYENINKYGYVWTNTHLSGFPLYSHVFQIAYNYYSWTTSYYISNIDAVSVRLIKD